MVQSDKKRPNSPTGPRRTAKGGPLWLNLPTNIFSTPLKVAFSCTSNWLKLRNSVANRYHRILFAPCTFTRHYDFGSLRHKDTKCAHSKQSRSIFILTAYTLMFKSSRILLRGTPSSRGFLQALCAAMTSLGSHTRESPPPPAAEVLAPDNLFSRAYIKATLSSRGHRSPSCTVGKTLQDGAQYEDLQEELSQW